MRHVRPPADAHTALRKGLTRLSASAPGRRVVWAFFRGTTRHSNPPRLHFKEWLKGFELNPCVPRFAFAPHTWSGLLAQCRHAMRAGSRAWPWCSSRWPSAA